MDSLGDLRKQIDEIDGKIIGMLAKRFVVVKKIGLCKKKHQLRPFDQKRWQEVIDSRVRQGKLFSLEDNFVIDIFNLIHDQALKIENEA
ncbi:chorismate mutase [Candidatus Roizmanbacteria bacterium]|jgi:chorismate mutase|nr:chorismate mutase [Candidatus Roizmanbacteria bacterium]